MALHATEEEHAFEDELAQKIGFDCRALQDQTLFGRVRVMSAFQDRWMRQINKGRPQDTLPYWNWLPSWN